MPCMLDGEWYRVTHRNLVNEYGAGPYRRINQERSVYIELACPGVVAGGVLYLVSSECERLTTTYPTE